MADLAERLKVDAWNHGMQECNSRMAETFLVPGAETESSRSKTSKPKKALVKSHSDFRVRESVMCSSFTRG